MSNERCKKHGCTAMFWCKLQPGHKGLCENGVHYSDEPYRGSVDDAVVSIKRMVASMEKNQLTNHGRKSTAWKDQLALQRIGLEAIRKMNEHLEKELGEFDVQPTETEAKPFCVNYARDLASPESIKTERFRTVGDADRRAADLVHNSCINFITVTNDTHLLGKYKWLGIKCNETAA